jgi:hypothetical protein
VKLTEQWQAGLIPAKGLQDTLKSYAVQFYDVPAAQFNKAPRTPENPFSGNERKPR